MKNTNIFNKFLIFFILFSCNNEKDKTNSNLIYSNFAETVSIKSSNIKGIDQAIMPLHLGINDDLLILCDPQSEYRFYAYKLPEFKFLGKFGKEGDGPKEISETMIFLNQFEKNKDGIFINFFEPNKMKYVSMNLNKALNDSLEDNDFKITYMPPEIQESYNIIKLKNNTFFGSGFSLAGEFFIYDENTASFRWKDQTVDHNDDFMKSLKENNLLDMYKHGALKAKPDNSHFVKAYQFTPKISVYDSDGNLKFSIINESKKEPKIVNNQFEENTRMYYFTTYVTDDYIYAIDLNCTQKEFRSGGINNVELHVFDWDGNPIKKYLLNEGIGALSPFAVDEKNNKLYTVNPKSEESYFSQFSLD